MSKKIQVTITGSGTPSGLAYDLRQIADRVEDLSENDLPYTWEEGSLEVEAKISNNQ